MRRRSSVSILSALAVAAGLAVAVVPAGSAAPQAAPASRSAGPTVYVGDLTAKQFGALHGAGLDREDISAEPAAGDKIAVEVVVDRGLAGKLIGSGIPLKEKRIDGQPVSRLLAAAEDPVVFRSYSEPGGIRDELVQVTQDNPGLTKLVRIGTTVQGQAMYAVKVTKNARSVKDGSRPAVLYSSAQHAREWITPEMNRRLMHYVIDGYATDSRIRRLLNTTELWFVPVANPDGYDYTFTGENRLWRKNLRDNDGDGVITGQDGVDPNRNYPTKWGYDNEGSSPSFGSDTYRGSAPASEPETRAMVGLMKRIDFALQINYHSAAELLLYGVGWQVSTRSPDDLIFEAQAGDDANPAVPGYDPDQSAELYTTNGETTEHAHDAYGTLAYTPEMSTCASASAVDPDDEFEPEDCESVFNFPDSETLVQAEFEKNIPFALAVAESARNPAHPVSPVGRTAPDFEVDSFDVSYGDPQTVAVTARRELRGLVMKYSINGRHAKTSGTKLWKGGERYGEEGTTYYGEFRGVVRGAKPGDRVKVWFTAVKPGKGRRTSASFTYRLAQDSNRKVIIIADEDTNGVNPTYPPGTTSKYVPTYLQALNRAGLRATVWDVSTQGVPHHLGVLSHFRGAVWYLGDNRLTQDPEDEVTETFFGDFEDVAVAEREQELTIAVRDFLNEGGKLVHTGETATMYAGPDFPAGINGLYYGLNGDPSADCVVTEDPFSDCLLLADDFAQYYLGRYSRQTSDTATAFAGAGALAGTGGDFGGPAVADNPIDEAGIFPATSSVLTPDKFPQFTGATAGTYVPSGGPFDPVEGSMYVGGLHVDDSYMRLTRTVDLTGVTAGSAPTLRSQLSFDVEPDFDHVIVEAHTVGQEDWTTLPEAGGLTTTTVPAECEVGYLLESHPFLLHYLTAGDPCGNTGTSGAWNAMTGSSGGWQDVAFDLSAYAGQQVEVSISFVTDPAFAGTGVFIDDTRLVVDGSVVESEGFETGLGPWTIAPPPPGSSPGTGTYVRSANLFSPAVRTPDTVLLGFGAEQVDSPADQAAILGRALRSVGVN